MTTRTWLCTAVLAMALPASIVTTGCGDDTETTTGGGGEGGSGGGVGGDVTTGGAPPNFDTCDSAGAIDVDLNEEAVAEGTMAGSKDDYGTFCADADTMPDLSYPDVVYKLHVGGACTATLTLDGDQGFDGVLSLRTVACETDEFCSNASATAAENIAVHLEEGDYSVIVSDAGTGTENFTLTVGCATPACGDGVTNPFEECDDGNTADGDGCAADCLFEASDPSLDTCAGAAKTAGTVLGTGELVHIPGQAPERTTIGATESGESTCQTASVSPAPDHVYKVIPEANGTLVATLGLDFEGNPYCGTTEPTKLPYPPGCWDRAVHIREATCDIPEAEVACSDTTTTWWATEAASAEVVAGTEYYVFVDGYNNDEFGQGLYVLQLELN